VIPLILSVFLFYSFGNNLRDKIRDEARDIWKPSNDDPPQRIDVTTSSESQFRALRSYRKLMNSLLRHYRRLMDWLQPKFDLAKFFGRIAVILGFALVLIVGNVALSRILFNLQLGSGGICMPSEKLRWLGANKTSDTDGSELSDETFATNSLCWASRMAVEKGIAYRLRIDIDPEDPWFDGAIMTDVGGFENDGLLLKIVKSPLRRWTSAGWFQPIARIGAKGDIEWPLASNDGSGPILADREPCTRMAKSYLETEEFCSAHQQSLPCPEQRNKTTAEMGASLIWPSQPLPNSERESAKTAWNNVDYKKAWPSPRDLKPQDCYSSYPRKTLVADFVAQKTGELFLFANDAIPLWWLSNDTHYRNNSGSAKVTLMRVPFIRAGATGNNN
jgi:hypothetical protein